MSTTDTWIACADYIRAALIREMDKRKSNPDGWIEAERQAVAMAANEWALAHGRPAATTVDDVERLEVTALGHVDYGRKLSLRIAEHVLGLR